MIYLKTDEEIELMRNANQLVGKTLAEIAKHIAPGVSTLQLDKVAEELGFSEQEKMDKMAQFYTNLSLDGKFVVLQDNHWDLRERVSFDKVHIDMNEAYNDIDEEDEDKSEIDDTTSLLGEDEQKEGDFESSDDDSSDDDIQKELDA